MKEEGNFAILGRVVGVATSTLEGGGREAPNDPRARQWPVGDARYIVVDLEFDDPEAAHGFKEFLEGVVWQSKDLSPGLDGVPTARVLADVDPARLK